MIRPCVALLQHHNHDQSHPPVTDKTTVVFTEMIQPSVHWLPTPELAEGATNGVIQLASESLMSTNMVSKSANQPKCWSTTIGSVFHKTKETTK